MKIVGNKSKVDLIIMKYRVGLAVLLCMDLYAGAGYVYFLNYFKTELTKLASVVINAENLPRSGRGMCPPVARIIRSYNTYSSLPAKMCFHGIMFISSIHQNYSPTGLNTNYIWNNTYKLRSIVLTDTLVNYTYTI